jgi:DNA-binding CsgD family transcriptional regulator
MMSGSLSGRRNCIQLSDREREVLRLVASGMTSKEVANALFCSKRTVDYHLWRAYGKLGVSNRVQAIHSANEVWAA